MRLLIKLLLAVLLLAGGIIAGLYWGTMVSAPKAEENTSVVVEKIEKVAKLITVETHLSEIYSYKDYYNYDWSWLRKKALLRVNAKVSAGYDLKKLNIKVDNKTKTIHIGPIPKVEILSVDHSLDYFNIEEGVFNSFTPQDYNKINANAKEYIKKIAGQNEVLQQAAAQENTMVEMMATMAKGMGYTLKVETGAPAVIQ